MNKQRSASLLGSRPRGVARGRRLRQRQRRSSTTDAPADTTAGTTGDTTAGTAAAEASGEAVSLAGDCPDTVVIQTDWMPEAEHGFLYQMVGEGYEIDAGKAYVTGPLIDAGGNDTGVKIQIRSGGAAAELHTGQRRSCTRTTTSSSATSTPTRRSSSRAASSRPWPSSRDSRRTRR